MEESTTRLLQLIFRWTIMPTLKAFDRFNPLCKFYLSCTPSDGHCGFTYWNKEDLLVWPKVIINLKCCRFGIKEFKQASPNNEMLAKYPKSCCIVGLGLKSSEEFLILKTILWLKRMKKLIANFSLFAKDEIWG